ncbi:MAG: T9SS type A sorting domain-containing protein [Bacteroidia bacterium]
MAHESDVPFNFNSSEAEYKSALREENGKVMVVESGFINEHILYDFNKIAGDTIRFYRPSGNINQGVLPGYTTGKIYKTDQVTMNGVLRKRWFIHDPEMIDMIPPQAYSQLDSQADIWIEGLGAKTGLFSRMPEWGVVGPEPYLLACVEQDGNLVYQNNTGYDADPEDPCFITPPGGSGGGNDSLILSMRSNSETQIRTYPNPATERVTLFPVPGDFVSVSLTDYRGITVLNTRMPVQREHLQLNVSEYRTGIYILHVQNVSVDRSFRNQNCALMMLC